MRSKNWLAPMLVRSWLPVERMVLQRMIVILMRAVVFPAWRRDRGLFLPQQINCRIKLVGVLPVVVIVVLIIRLGWWKCRGASSEKKRVLPPTVRPLLSEARAVDIR